MAEQGEPGIGGRTLRGMLWAYGSYVGGRVLVLVATAVLARLLSPEDFGLVALALIFTGLLETVKDLGVTQALVVADEEEVLERAETAWLFSVGLGAALTLLVAALSPLAALFFDEPELTGLLSVLGLNFLLRALGATHYALAQKRLDFRSRTAAEVADVVVRGAAGIGLAIAGAGAWSLVAGYLVGTIAMTSVLWIRVRWRPSLRAQRRHLRQLVRFGGTLTGVDIVAAAIANADYVFVGRVLGAASLGLYTLAFRLPELIIRNLAVVAGQVLFPAFAAVKREDLGHAFLVSFRYTLIIAVPLSAVLALLAEPFVLAAFGDQWRGAVGAMQVLSIYALTSTLGIPAGTAYKSTGRAAVILKLSIPRLLLLIVSLAIFTDEGIVAVAACQAVGSGLLALANTLLAARLLEVGLTAILRTAWAPFAGAAALAAVVVPIERAIESPWPALLAGGAAGAIAYLAVLWLLARDAFADILAKAVPGRFGRAEPAVSPELGVAEGRERDAIP